MKKIISLLLMVVMIVASLPTFASEEQSQEMKDVLIKVKDKIHIPDELSEFEGNVSDYDDKITYRFEWHTPEYEKSIYVISDNKGRILSYDNNSYKTGNKKISNATKQQIVDCSYEFLKKTVPECFANDNDLLVFDENSYSANGSLVYNLEFKRCVNGIPVKDNYSSVNVAVIDDNIYIRNINVNMDYDATFDIPSKDIDNYAQEYKNLYPLELVYRNQYNNFAKANEPKYQPKLIYRVKDNNIGYMDSATGQVVLEDEKDTYFSKGEIFEDTSDSMNSAMGSGSLTPQELKELENIEGLLSVEDIEKTVKKLPDIKITNEYTPERSRLYKDVYGRYFCDFDLSFENEDDYDYFSVRADAKTGEIYHLSSSLGIYESDKELTQAETENAQNTINKFAKLISEDKFATVQKTNTSASGGNYTQDYVRMVNGVKYINNTISITYNTVNNVITRYNCNFIDAQFDDPKNAISPNMAYKIVEEYSPVVPLLVKSGGVYKKVFTLQKTAVSVDAISGEMLNKQSEYNYNYSDISGHWVEDMAVKLAENQIGIKGDKLNPEAQIKQSELLYLLSSAINGKFYVDLTLDELYEELIHYGIISEEEKDPDALVKREDAFVYVVRFAGYEKIAKLDNIFKVSYADGDKVSKGKIGYAAILSGLGVICGDGGNLYPQSNITRAEALSMVYKYLLSFGM